MAKMLKFVSKKPESDSSCNTLRTALRDNVEDIIVVGRTKDGNLYLSSENDSIPDIVYLLELAKKEAMEL